MKSVFLTVFILIYVLVISCTEEDPNTFVVGHINEFIEDYWTTDRMLSAIPRTLIIDEDGKLTYPVDERSNESKFASEGQTCSSSTCCTDCCSNDVLQTKSPFYSTWPNKAIGKVFFNLGNSTYVCSGSVGGDNVVWTAGHCVYDNQAKIWATNWMFIPGYMSGKQPMGQWIAFNLYTTSGWINGDFRYDYALTEMNPNTAGNSSSKVVGGALGLNYNIKSTDTTHYNSYGYPQAYPFNGAWNNVCEKSSGCRRDGTESNSPVGIGCDSTGGSSGGPWITSESPTSIAGLNSYIYLNINNVMFSPYFDKNTRGFFDFVIQNLTSSF